MIQGVSMTMGVMIIMAARTPLRHAMFIWFVVWSSVVHGGIMAYQVPVDSVELGHFIVDIPALFLVAAVLGVALRNELANA